MNPSSKLTHLVNSDNCLEEEFPDDVLDSSFLSYFLNFLHTAAAKLCEIKPNCGSTTAVNLDQQRFSKDVHLGKIASVSNADTTNSKSSFFPSSSFIAEKNPKDLVSYKRNKRSKTKSSPPAPFFETAVLNSSGSSTLTNVKRHGKKRTDFKRQSSPVISSQVFDISNKQDFPVLDSSSNSVSQPVFNSCNKKASRRIKPTLILEKSDELSIFSADKTKSEFGSDSKSVDMRLDIEVERKLLLRTRVSSVTEEIPNLEKKAIQVEESFKELFYCLKPVNLEKKKITDTFQHLAYTTELKRLAMLYAHCIKTMSVASITAELHLLFAMISLNFDGRCELPPDFKALEHFLSSPIRARMFAAYTIMELWEKNILFILSDETLSLLHADVANKEEMNFIAERVKTEIAHRKSANYVVNSCVTGFAEVGSVPFKPETDGKNNFTSERSFHSFRKQRDMFYSLMREWREKSDMGSMSKDVVGKLHWLVAQVKTNATFPAFLRLFIDQLLITGAEKHGSVSRSASHPMLSRILSHDPEKHRRLESRATTASQPNSSHASLFKDLHFFKDFVNIADCYSLSVRLCDELSTKIMELEAQNSQIEAANEENDGSSDPAKISQALMSLRICGNFYGYITFYPYKSDDSERNISLMECTAGQFIAKSLERALKNGHLLLTVPWIVQFLCFIPSVCLEKQVFSCVLKNLCSIYRMAASSNAHDKLSTLQLLMCVTIGYLFEQEHIGEELFYQNRSHSLTVQHHMDVNSVDANADRVVGHDLFYKMHWRLREINTLLKSRSVSLSKRQLPKKIKPSTEKLPENSNLQAILEANFFHNQPFSLKRTVSFVSERCHSNCLKYICATVIPSYCDGCCDIARFRSACKNDKVTTESVKSLVVQLYDKAFKVVAEKATEFNRTNVRQCLTLLVSSTVSKPVLETAISITERESMDSVRVWLNDRLFDCLMSMIKASFSSKAAIAPATCQSSFSQVLNQLRETVISNRTIGDKTKALERAVSCLDDLASASRVDGVKQELPGHIKPVLSFLLRELLMPFVTSSSGELDALNSMSLSIDVKDVAKKFLASDS